MDDIFVGKLLKISVYFTSNFSFFRGLEVLFYVKMGAFLCQNSGFFIAQNWPKIDLKWVGNLVGDGRKLAYFLWLLKTFVSACLVG